MFSRDDLQDDDYARVLVLGEKVLAATLVLMFIS